MAIFGVMILSCLGLRHSGAGNFVAATRMAWLAPAEVDSLQQAEARPILVDVYTSWCYYCKVMDNTTWRHDSVVNYMQENFYAVKLNAEDKKPQQWNGKTYEYQPRYKVNMLAVELLKGNMVYPSTVIIPAKGEWTVVPGALKPAEIEMLLKFYGSRSNEKMDFEDYRRQFSGRWK